MQPAQVARPFGIVPILLSVSLFLSSAVGAQEEVRATPENVEAVTLARQYFEAGMRHFRQREFREALQQFQLSASAVPSADLSFNIARCYEEIGDAGALRAAVQYFERYLQDRMDAPDGVQVRARLEALQTRLQRLQERGVRERQESELRISASIDRAAVMVDGIRIGFTPRFETLRLSPGRHEIEISADSYIPWVAEVTTQPGRLHGLHAELRPLHFPPDLRRSRVGSVTFFVLSALAGISAAVFGGLAAGSDNREDSKSLALWSDASLGGALALGTIGFALTFWERAGRSD